MQLIVDRRIGFSLGLGKDSKLVAKTLEIPPSPPSKGGNRTLSPPFEGGFRGISRVFASMQMCRVGTAHHLSM
jgi:hypothetical protein